MISNLGLKGFNYLSVLILAPLLEPADFGTLNVFNTYVTIFQSLLTLNLGAGVIRYYYEENADFPGFLGTTLLAIGGLGLLSLPTFALFGALAGQWLNLPASAIRCIPVLVVLTTLPSIYATVAQVSYQTRKLAVVNLLTAFFGFAISIAITLGLREHRYWGQILAQLIVGLGFSGFFLAQLRGKVRWKLEQSLLGYNLRFSVPLILGQLASIAVGQFDLLYINSRLGSRDAGMYSFAYNIGMSQSLIVSSILTQAWAPRFYEHMKTRRFQLVDRDLGFIFRMVLVSAAAISLFSHEITALLRGQKYFEATEIIPVIVASYLLSAVYYAYAYYISESKKTVYYLGPTLISSAVNIGLNVWLIPRFGYPVAAWTTLAAFGAMAMAAWYLARYVIRIHATPLQVFFLPAIPFVVAVLAGLRLGRSVELAWLNAGCRAAVVLTLTAFLFAGRKVQPLIQSITRPSIS